MGAERKKDIRHFRDLDVYRRAFDAAMEDVSVFRNKMTDAMQEASETQCWLEFACACRYIASEVFQHLDAEYEAIIGMLNTMEMKSERFCY